MPKQVISNAKDKMAKAILAYSRELASIRAGRANASLLDRIYSGLLWCSNTC